MARRRPPMVRRRLYQELNLQQQVRQLQHLTTKWQIQPCIRHPVVGSVMSHHPVGSAPTACPQLGGHMSLQHRRHTLGVTPNSRTRDLHPLTVAAAPIT